MIAPPGRPKITSTPSSCRQRLRICDPLSLTPSALPPERPDAAVDLPPEHTECREDARSPSRRLPSFAPLRPEKTEWPPSAWDEGHSWYHPAWRDRTTTTASGRVPVRSPGWSRRPPRDRAEDQKTPPPKQGRGLPRGT